MKDNRNYGKGGRKFDKTSRADNSYKAETPEPSVDRLEGRNAVTEAINAGREINKLWILEPSGGQRLDPGLAKILDEANKRKIVVIRSPRNVLDRMSQTHNHQGVIAAVASHEYVEIDDILKKAESEGIQPLLVVLDELKDAYNLGSVLRIADAAGVDGVVIPSTDP